jgi:hypothetical protein
MHINSNTKLRAFGNPTKIGEFRTNEKAFCRMLTTALTRECCGLQAEASDSIVQPPVFGYRRWPFRPQRLPKMSTLKPSEAQRIATPANVAGQNHVQSHSPMQHHRRTIHYTGSKSGRLTISSRHSFFGCTDWRRECHHVATTKMTRVFTVYAKLPKLPT